MSFLDGLNPQQLQAVQDTEGVMLVLAGAGSGKTKVLTCRIANLLSHGIMGDSILAITFTNKAAREMKERTLNLVGAQASNVWLMTFHSFCVKFLRREIGFISGYNQNFTIYDDVDSKNMVKAIIKDFNSSVSYQDTLDWISRVKNELRDVDDFEPDELNSFQQEKFGIFKEYQSRLRKFNAVDFDDLLLYTGKILKNNPEAKKFWQDKFHYILIDEYQDTNYAQYTIVKELFTGNLCVVGDVDQSIYGFRGADIRNINNFNIDYPGYKLIKLEQNYRSTAKILDAANAVIENNVKRPKKNLWTAAGDGQKIIIKRLKDDWEESLFVLKSIETLMEQYQLQYKDIAVLYRTNVQSRSIEDCFIRNNVPYVLIGGVRFYDRREIRDILAYLRCILNPYDTGSLLRAFQFPKRGVGSKMLKNIQAEADRRNWNIYDVFCDIQNTAFSDKVKSVVSDFVGFIRRMQQSPSLVDLFRSVMMETSYVEALAKEFPSDMEERNANILEFFGLIKGYIAEGNGSNDLLGFMDRISLLTDVDRKDTDKDVVTLMTVHAAKGLEYPAVFMVGMEEGLFPHNRSLNEGIDSIEEERRLCYVAMTRAKKYLFISSVEQRFVYGRCLDMEPSRFIGEIPLGCLEF